MRYLLASTGLLAGLAMVAGGRHTYGPGLVDRTAMQLSALGDAVPLGLTLLAAAIFVAGGMLVAGRSVATLGLAALAVAAVGLAMMHPQAVEGIVGGWLPVG